jgi:spore cortex formation protein SpoVR/YcgB (stage V sporulation)
MFKQWTQADAIVDYMKFARDYILKCEEIYGIEKVEEVIDACHAISDYGIDKYKKPKKLSPEKEKERFLSALEFERKDYDPLWTTIPGYIKKKKKVYKRSKKFPKQPEENILYFIEKNSPLLPTWKREIVRICRKVSQYFYPQGQTKMINEGFACFTHYYIVNKLYDEGYLSDGFMLEFIKHHSSVIYQPTYRSKYYSGLNPYTMGFNIFMDIKRICENPTEEDKQWMPQLIGKDWREEILYAATNFRDDSFVAQYLSPKVIRDMRLFSIDDDEKQARLNISSIHDGVGYKKIIEVLSNQYNRERYIPDIQITDYAKHGDRSLTLTHFKREGKAINYIDAEEVTYNIYKLWDFPVYLISEDGEGFIDEIAQFD